jgi:hypothetical protein
MISELSTTAIKYGQHPAGYRPGFFRPFPPQVKGVFVVVGRGRGLSFLRSAPRLETGPQRQQNCTDCHKENARPVRFESQESHAAPSRLKSAANRPAGIRAAKRSPPNNSAHHVQDTAENEQRAKPYQEHFRLSIHRCPAQQNWNQSREGRIRSGRNNRREQNREVLGADAHVTIVDVPAFFAGIERAAAGELGHGLIEARYEGHAIIRD